MHCCFQKMFFFIFVFQCFGVASAGLTNELIYVQKTEKDTAVCNPDTAAFTDVSLNDHTSVKYADGIYTGESPGWTGMKVQVKIRCGSICQVRVLRAKGTPEFYKEVVQKMPRYMAKQGCVNVDGISGATLSSESLKEAVRNALIKAEKK
ncbi:FMN-binding protein [bacterium]|nr:FMN-binding protein [bacterium]